MYCTFLLSKFNKLQFLIKLENTKYFKNGTLLWENMHFSRTTNSKAPPSQYIA